jgi:alpha/beta superfamily hydrolase
MPDTWIVFGGWGVKPQILSPVFGPDAVLIDSNEVAPKLVRKGGIAPDWRKLLIDIAAPRIPQGDFHIAGWSTGSILAAALAEFVRPSSAVFISATPSFCRRQGFAFGWKPAIVQGMRGELAADRDWVLGKFYLQCGIDEAYRVSENADLSWGLLFLEQASLLPIAPFPFPSLFLHGNADTVVLPDAGKYFCREAGGSFKEFDGLHAFFANQCEEVKTAIESNNSYTCC